MTTEDVPSVQFLCEPLLKAPWLNATVAWWAPWQIRERAAGAGAAQALARSNASIRGKEIQGFTQLPVVPPLVPGVWHARLHDAISGVTAAGVDFPVVPVHATSAAHAELDGVVGRFWRVVALCVREGGGRRWTGQAPACTTMDWSAYQPRADLA